MPKLNRKTTLMATLMLIIIPTLVGVFIYEKTIFQVADASGNVPPLSITGESHSVKTYEEYLECMNLKDQVANSVEVSIDVPYHRPDAIEISLGQEKSVNGLFVQNRAERKIWTPQEARQMNLSKGFEITRLGNSSFRTITIKKEIIFNRINYGDLPSRITGSKWYIRIVTNSTIDYGHNDTETGEYHSCHGYLDNFKINIGGFFFETLDLPMFGQGWDIKSRISGIGTEVRKFPNRLSNTSKEMAHQTTKNSYHPASQGVNWEEWTPYSYEGVVVIVAVSNYNPDLENTWTLGDIDVSDSARYMKDRFIQTGRYRVHWLIDDPKPGWEGPFIDDDQMQECINILEYETNNDHPRAFLYIVAHGIERYPGTSIGNLLSGCTGSFVDNVVSESELCSISKITTGSNDQDVRLLYWMGNCHGDVFNLLWDNYYVHQNKVIFYYYAPKAVEDPQREREIEAFCNQTLDLYQDVKEAFPVVEDSFEKNHGDEGHHMYLKDKSDGDLALPGKYDFTYDCRTRGAGSQSASGSWSHSIKHVSQNYLGDLYSYHQVKEVSGTFKRYVGAYYDIPMYGPYYMTLNVKLNYRVKSDFSGSSSVTNFYIFIYSESWGTILASAGRYWTYTEDTGWLQDQTFTFNWWQSSSSTVHILICYNDAWSAIWHQTIEFYDVRFS